MAKVVADSTPGRRPWEEKSGRGMNPLTKVTVGLALALLLLTTVGASGAEAKSFQVTLAKEGVIQRATAECTTSGLRDRRLTCLTYGTALPRGARCNVGRAVRTMTLTSRGRPRPGFTCIRQASRRLPRLRVGERFRSGPFVCRHLWVKSLDGSVPWPKLTGGREGRLRCRRGSGPAGFSFNADASVTWPV